VVLLLSSVAGANWDKYTQLQLVMEMSNKSLNETGNQQLERRPSLQEVDDLASELCDLFKNDKYFRWYCKIIYALGIDRVVILKSRVSDAKLPGRLFTKYVKQDLAKLEAQRKLRVAYAKAKKPPVN
jgi:hypothetical protein